MYAFRKPPCFDVVYEQLVVVVGPAHIRGAGAVRVMPTGQHVLEDGLGLCYDALKRHLLPVHLCIGDGNTEIKL